MGGAWTHAKEKFLKAYAGRVVFLNENKELFIVRVNSAAVPLE